MKPENLPLVGADVFLRFGSDIVQSDAQGNFSIRVKQPNDTLIVRYLAYTTQRIPIGNNKLLNVTLQKPSGLIAADVIKKYAAYKGYDFFFKRCDENDRKSNALQFKSLEERYLYFSLPESFSAWCNLALPYQD